MKKIILIAFCLFATVSFSQELASVKVVESQTEKVVKSEQKEVPTTVVSEITKDTLSNTFKEPITTNATEVSGAIIASQGFFNEEFVARCFGDDFFTHNRLFI